jgi:uncharacterized protein YbjT (DUF2867 family)
MMVWRTGFLGSHLVENVTSYGAHVSPIERPTSAATRLERLGAKIIRGRLTGHDALERAMQGCD